MKKVGGGVAFVCTRGGQKMTDSDREKINEIINKWAEISKDEPKPKIFSCRIKIDDEKAEMSKPMLYQFWADEISACDMHYLKDVYPEKIPDNCLNLDEWEQWCSENRVSFKVVQSCYLVSCVHCNKQEEA
jgi:hypothetical protein